MHEIVVYACMYTIIIYMHVALSCGIGLSGIRFCVGQVVQSTGGSAISPSLVNPIAQMHNNGHSTEIAGT